MILHHRALATTASPEVHTFRIVNTYTGKSIECKLARETKCYYVMWSKELSGGRYLERRFHKATMSNDELMLIITVTADDVAQTEKEIAAKVAFNKADTAARIEAVKVREAAEAAPIAHDAPTFCGNCETYAKHDEMIVNDSTQILVCIDCDDELDTAALELLTTIKNVALLNYMGGHLAGHNFTPTLKELPRMLIAYQPNRGNEGSPAAMVNTIGGFLVKPSPCSMLRVLYNACGEYITHGDHDHLTATLNAIIAGV